MLNKYICYPMQQLVFTKLSSVFYMKIDSVKWLFVINSLYSFVWIDLVLLDISIKSISTFIIVFQFEPTFDSTL